LSTLDLTDAQVCIAQDWEALRSAVPEAMGHATIQRA
jgi:hypothetical protein